MPSSLGSDLCPLISTGLFAGGGWAAPAAMDHTLGKVAEQDGVGASGWPDSGAYLGLLSARCVLFSLMQAFLERNLILPWVSLLPVGSISQDPAWIEARRDSSTG